MVRFEELAKGIGMFLFANLLYYFAWFMFKAILDFTVGEEPYLGALAWISFVLMYAFTAVIYPIFCVFVNAKNDSQTNIKPIGLANVYWAVGTIGALIIWWIMDVLLSALTSVDAAIGTGVSGEGTLTTVLWVGWLMVIVVYVIYLVVLPANYLVKGFTGQD